jgi:hypothetical protein
MGGAVSDVVSSVGDAVGGVVQGVSDTVSSIGESDLGKAALIAAAVASANPELIPAITGSAGGATALGDMAATGAGGGVTAGGIGGAAGAAAAASSVAAANAASGGGATALGDMAGTGAGSGVTSGGVGGATGAAQAQAAVDAAKGAGGLSSILSSAGGKMDLSSFSSILNIASGINSLTGGGISSALGIGPGSTPTGTQAQTMADPFAPYRNTLAGWYAGALTPGAQTDITQMPGYSQYKSGVLDPAMDASKRSAAASGQLYSGNESLALQKTGQQGYYGFMSDYLNRLAQGSGATQAPAQAAGMGLAQTSANQQAFSQGLGGVGQGIAGLFPSTAGSTATGGITSAAMNAPGVADIYGSGTVLPMGYANF